MWYVLQVATGQEIAVRDALKDMGIPAFAPQENRLIRKGGDWVHKEYTLFPSYVFVSLEYTAEHYYQVKSIPHVLRFLGPSGLAPSALTFLEAEWIKLLTGTGGQPLQPTQIQEQPDGSFQILSGVLASFAAHSIEYDKRSHKAKLELTICSQPKTVQLSVEIVNST